MNKMSFSKDGKLFINIRKISETGKYEKREKREKC